MKKNTNQLVICILILMLSVLFIGDLHQAQAFINPKQNYNIAEGSKEELYRDVIITMLLPYIDKEVEKYYGKPYIVAPYSTFVKSITRPYSGMNYTYQIVLEISPYWGPHNMYFASPFCNEMQCKSVTPQIVFSC